MDRREKKFLNIPHLDGGREELKKFLRENLQYPQEALEKGVEGDVIVKYKVTGKGEVIETEVEKGIGHGCDEEALRLVRMLHYQSVKNRGVRVVSGKRIRIPFRIPKRPKGKVSLSYKEAPKGGKENKPAGGEKKEGKRVYTYTIRY